MDKARILKRDFFSVAYFGRCSFLLYPVSTNGIHAAEYINSFSLHLISGVSANETSFAWYGLTGIIKNNATVFRSPVFQ